MTSDTVAVYVGKIHSVPAGTSTRGTFYPRVPFMEAVKLTRIICVCRDASNSSDLSS